MKPPVEPAERSPRQRIRPTGSSRVVYLQLGPVSVRRRCATRWSIATLVSTSFTRRRAGVGAHSGSRGGSARSERRSRAWARWAGGRRRERLADCLHPLGAQTSDALGAQRSADRRDVVERQRTRPRHSVTLAKGHLGRDAANRPCGRHAEDLAEDRDRLVAGEDQKWPASCARVFIPPDLATAHHGGCPLARSSASSRWSSSSVEASPTPARFPHSSGSTWGTRR